MNQPLDLSGIEGAIAEVRGLRSEMEQQLSDGTSRLCAGFDRLSRNNAVGMGIAPASGAAGPRPRAPLQRATGRYHSVRPVRSCPARGRAGQQPGRLRSPNFQPHRSE